MKQHKVPVCVRGMPDAKAIAVAEAGMFWVIKTRPVDVKVKGPWCRIMGYRLSVKKSGLGVGWFPSVAAALVAADQLMEAGPDLCERLWELGPLVKVSEFPEAKACLEVVKAWKETYGDPIC